MPFILGTRTPAVIAESAIHAAKLATSKLFGTNRADLSADTLHACQDFAEIAMNDLVILKDFLFLCQVKSFSRAAEGRHVSVSGLSRRMQGLEQWLGIPVFVRHKTSIELTDAGLKLQAVASEVVYALEGLRKAVRDDGADRQARIRFAAPHVLSAVFFPDWISRLHSDFQDAKFSVTSDKLPDCLDMLEDGSADYVVALFDEAGAVGRRLGMDLSSADRRWMEMGQERLVPVSAPNAAGKPLFDLHREGPISFLAYAPDCHLGWALEPRLANWPLTLERNHKSGFTDGLRFMALSKLGVAWLPFALVRDDLAARRLVRAGDARHDVALRFLLLRPRQALASQAEKLWRHLEALTPGMNVAAVPCPLAA